MSGFAISRLVEERKIWRKNHPFGFSAKPKRRDDGSLDIMKWVCVIPGKRNTPWEGGNYSIIIDFSHDFPLQPPRCRFKPPIFHPNVYADGTVCLSILSEEGWRPTTDVRQILVGIQDLLDEPNVNDAANEKPYLMYCCDRSKYDEKIREQAAAMHSGI